MAGTIRLVCAVILCVGSACAPTALAAECGLLDRALASAHSLAYVAERTVRRLPADIRKFDFARFHQRAKEDAATLQSGGAPSRPDSTSLEDRLAYFEAVSKKLFPSSPSVVNEAGFAQGVDLFALSRAFHGIDFKRGLSRDQVEQLSRNLALVWLPSSFEDPRLRLIQARLGLEKARRDLFPFLQALKGTREPGLWEQAIAVWHHHKALGQSALTVLFDVLPLLRGAAPLYAPSIDSLDHVPIPDDLYQRAVVDLTQAQPELLARMGGHSTFDAGSHLLAKAAAGLLTVVMANFLYQRSKRMIAAILAWEKKKKHIQTKISSISRSAAPTIPSMKDQQFADWRDDYRNANGKYPVPGSPDYQQAEWVIYGRR